MTFAYGKSGEGFSYDHIGTYSTSAYSKSCTNAAFGGDPAGGHVKYCFFKYGLDSDGDGVDNVYDNCDYVMNSGQADTDYDGFGNSCDSANNDIRVSGVDEDFDGIDDAVDYCPGVKNANSNHDRDYNGLGDSVCDQSDPYKTIVTTGSAFEFWTLSAGVASYPGSSVTFEDNGDGLTTYYYAPSNYSGDLSMFSSIEFSIQSSGGTYYETSEGDLRIIATDGSYGYYNLGYRPTNETVRVLLADVTASDEGWTLSGAFRLSDILENVEFIDIRGEYGSGDDEGSLSYVRLTKYDRDGKLYIKTVPNRCIATTDAVGSAYPEVYLEDCSDLATDEWTFRNTGEIETAGDYCLEPVDSSPSAGTELQTRACSEVTVRWDWETTNRTNAGKLKLRGTNYCVATKSGGHTYQPAMHLWHCNGSVQDNFIFGWRSPTGWLKPTPETY